MIIRTRIKHAFQVWTNNQQNWQMRINTHDIGDVETSKLDIMTDHYSPDGIHFFACWKPIFVTDDPVAFMQYMEANQGKVHFAYEYATTKNPQSDGTMFDMFMDQGRPIPNNQILDSCSPKNASKTSDSKSKRRQQPTENMET